MALADLLHKLKGGSGDSGPSIGLYISPELVVVTEAVEEKGKPVVKMTASIPIPKSGEATRMGTLNTDFLSESAKLVELIKPVLSQTGWQGKRLVVSLSPHFGLSRYFVMPWVDRRFWKQSVPLEAKKYIPFPLGELKYDFQVFNVPKGADGRMRMGVLFAVTPLKNIDSLQALAKALTMDLTAVELSAFSSGRVWKGLAGPSQPNSATAQVHFDKQSAYIVLHDAGVPYIAREVHWQGELQDRRRIDLQGSIDFAKKQLGLSEVKVLLSGSVDLGTWLQGLQEESLIQLETVDLPKSLGIAQPEWPLLVSIGASLRLAGREGVTVDISQAYEKLTEDPRVIRALAAVAGTLAGLLLLLSLFAQLRVVSTSRKLYNLKRMTSDITVFDGLQGAQIDDVVNKVKRQSSYFEDVMGPRDFVSPWYSVLAGAMPETVWIETLNFEAALGAKAGAKSLTMGGYAYGTDKNNDIALANQLRDGLKKDPVFSKVFPECDLSFEGSRGDREEYRRTAFTIRCEKRAPGMGAPPI